jgi:hypothetical protein
MLPYCATAKMNANIAAAKKVLNYTNECLKQELIRDAFHLCVRNGHADKGGSANINAYITARDFLMAHASWKTLTCNLCKESPKKGSDMCAFHASYA